MRRLVVLVAVATGVTLLPAMPAEATHPGLDGVIAGIGGYSDPVLLDLRTGTVTTLMKLGQEEESPAWAPSGDRLAVTSGVDLVTIRPDGTGKVTVVGGGCGGRHPTWNADGAEIAYADCTGLAIVNADGTDPHEVPNGEGFFFAEWSPNGDWIAGARYTDGNYDIWKIRPDGSDATQLTWLPGDQITPTWDPDGSRIAFEDRQTGDWNISLVDAEGGDVTVLTDDAGDDYEPTWSPSGTRIAFGSKRLGGGLFTMAPDGSNVVEIPNGDGIGSPVWQPAQVTVSTSRAVVPVGRSVTLQIKIAAVDTPQPSVVVYRRTSGAWATWRQVQVDATGRASLEAVISEKTSFRAIWGGDPTHPGGTSLATTISARVTVSGRLFRSYDTSGRWHLYHVGKPVWYRSTIAPPLGGLRMCFELERLRDGTWRSIGTDCFKIQPDGRVVIFIANVPLGSKERIRAVFRSTETYEGDETPWAYFRVTR